MRLCLVRGEAPNGDAETCTDRLSNRAHRYTLFGHAMQARSGCCLLERESKEPRRVQPMHGGPSIRAVADEGGEARAARDVEQRGHEAVVARTVDGGRQPNDAG